MTTAGNAVIIKKKKQDSHPKNAQVNMTVQEYLISLSQGELSYIPHMAEKPPRLDYPNLRSEPDVSVPTLLGGLWG